MYSKDKRNPMLGLGMTTAMAAVMLSGCAANVGPRAEVAAADARVAMANGQTSAAIQSAEAAVAAEPRNASYRLTLGNAYLEAGRFASASTSFEDAMALGDNSPRAALSLALALTGQARYSEASAVLSEWETEIAASDLGLAFALAGQPERGVHILSNAIRGGDSTVKTRQNLAYAYAVAGRWREARMMVAQDVPAHEVGARMEEWAQLTHGDAYQARVAGLLGVPSHVRDNGQPIQLALVNAPSAVQLAAETSTQVDANGELAAVDAERVSVPATGTELPTVGAPAVQPTAFASAFGSAPALPRMEAPSSRYNSQPVVQNVPGNAPSAFAPPPPAAPSASAPRTPEIARPALVNSRPAATASAAAAPASAPAPVAAPVADPTHLVQLGSFSSEAGAMRAWDIYVARYPELADRERVITQAVVNGRNYWRVSAGGFDRASSNAMCGRVDASNGEGCISWAASSPLPGAIDTGVRLARR